MLLLEAVRAIFNGIKSTEVFSTLSFANIRTYVIFPRDLRAHTRSSGNHLGHLGQLTTTPANHLKSNDTNVFTVSHFVTVPIVLELTTNSVEEGDFFTGEFVLVLLLSGFLFFVLI